MCIRDSFATGSGYTCTLYLLDGKNIVKGRKIVQLSNAMSLKIADCLKQQKDVPYREEEFICNLEGLQADVYKRQVQWKRYIQKIWRLKLEKEMSYVKGKRSQS